jgi:predicted dehydrogenase
MTKLRVAVVGGGHWGRNHIRTVAGLAEAELAAVCDVSSRVREGAARQYPGALVTADVGEALAAADAVVVATPAASHAELALQAIANGLPVLVEKPFALSAADARSVVEAAETNDVPVMVGHLLVFHPAVERLKAMLEGGELGTPYYLYSQRVNLGQVRPDENALWSFGPHDISVALALLGESPVKVYAHGRSYLQPGIEDVVFMTMEFASGIMAHVQMSWLDPRKERRLTVVGSRRMAVLDDMEAREKLRVYDKGVDRPPEYSSYGESLAVREGDITIPRIPNVEPLSAELRHFVQVAQRTARARVDGRHGLVVVEILEAASRSLREGGAGIELPSSITSGVDA